jgi:hypothetical protein
MSQNDFSKYLVDNPLISAIADKPVKNITFPPLQLMSSAQVPEAKYTIELAWVTGIPDPDHSTPMHRHDYPEINLYIGGDCRDPERLGAEIVYNLGGQKLIIDSTGAVYIPAGVLHGESTWKQFQKPHVKISIAVGTSARQPGLKSQPISGLQSSAINYSKYQVKKPAYEVLTGTPVKGRQGPSSMTFINNNLVPGSHIYVEGGWVWDIPEPNPHIFEHVHDYEEMVIHYGSDYRQPLELGAEIEFCVGGQPLQISKTSAVYVPSGIKHGPLTWKHYQYPHFEMAIMPGAGTLDEADPGGHREKTRRNSQNG